MHSVMNRVRKGKINYYKVVYRMNQKEGKQTNNGVANLVPNTNLDTTLQKYDFISHVELRKIVEKNYRQKRKKTK